MKRLLCIVLVAIFVLNLAGPVLAQEENLPSTPVVTADPVVTPEAPGLDLKDLAISAGSSMIQSAGRYAYNYLLTNETEAPILKFLVGFAAGYQATALLEIQAALSQITQQLSQIQDQLSTLSDQIAQGFLEMQDTVLQGQYTALVAANVEPVEQAIADSWSGYIFLSHQSALIAAQLADNPDALAQVQEQEVQLKSQYANWNAMQIRWDSWVSSYGQDGALDEGYAQWVRDTEKIDFADCLNKLAALMHSTVGEDTLLSVQKKRLQNQYPFEHQITPEMEFTFCYVSSLQARLLVLYRDYTDYLNFVDAQAEYNDNQAAEAAQKRIDTRSVNYRYHAQVAIETMNQAAEESGIEQLMQPDQIHQTLLMEDGSQLPVYYLRANSDGKLYCIAKQAPRLGDMIEENVTSLYSSFSVSQQYQAMLKTQDSRFRVINPEKAGRGLEGLLERCSGNVLLWLRADGGLTELDAQAQTILTDKIISSADHSGGYTLYDDTVYHLDLQILDHNQPMADQYQSFSAYDIQAGSKDFYGTTYPNVKFLLIFCDMHPANQNHTIQVTQLSQIADEMCLLDGDVLDLSNTYGDAGHKTIYVSGKVKIIGGGAGKPVENLTVSAAKGTELTLQDLYFSGSEEENGALTGTGTFRLILNGSNQIRQGSAKNALSADISVLPGTGTQLELQAQSGMCIAGQNFQAKGITLVTSANQMEAAPQEGLLENCVLHSASGRYDMDKLTVKNCTWTDHAPYKITVQTGSILYAGTGDSVKLTLADITISFNRALNSSQTQTFFTYGKALTQLPEEVSLKMDGSDDWYGISIQLYTNLTDYSVPDGRYMVCQWVDEESLQLKNHNLGVKLQILTDDISGAGTDSDISAAMGWLNESGQLVTGEFCNISDRTEGNAFEAGSSDTVYFRQDQIPEDMTPEALCFLVLKSDASLAGSDWKLASVTVTRMQAGQEESAVTIHPDQWIITEDYPYAFALQPQISRQYRLVIKTGDKLLAGTDANISFQLEGSNGTTNWITANPYITGNAFERNDTDKVMLTFQANVGKITGVNIRSDLWGAGAGWYCDYVEIWEYDPLTKGTANHVKVSVCNWFEDDDSKSQSFCGKSISLLQGENGSSVGKELSFVLEQLLEEYGTLTVHRADTLQGTYRQVAQLPDDPIEKAESDTQPGEDYFFKVFHKKDDGTYAQVIEIFRMIPGQGILEIPQRTVRREDMTPEHITPALQQAGMTSVEQIRQSLYQQLLTQNKTIRLENTALYEMQLQILHDGKWTAAEVKDFPEEGQIIASVPAPAGSDPTRDTYYGVHMFSENALDRKAGQTEVLTVQTHTDEDGVVFLDFYMTGMSPVLIGWSSQAEDDPSAPGDNPDTGDEFPVFLLGLILAGAGLVCLIPGRRKI